MREPADSRILNKSTFCYGSHRYLLAARNARFYPAPSSVVLSAAMERRARSATFRWTSRIYGASPALEYFSLSLCS